MTKLAYAICEQQRCRLACTPTQSGQRLWWSLIAIVAISDISKLLLAFLAEQASLSLTWPKTPKTDFLVTWPIKSLLNRSDYSIMLVLYFLGEPPSIQRKNEKSRWYTGSNAVITI